MIAIIIWSVLSVLFAFLLFLTIKKSFVTIQQGTVGIITRWGKFNKIAQTGLNTKFPFIDRLSSTISTQNIPFEAKFQAVTSDQANVFFNAMILYSVLNTKDETIKTVAFKFTDVNSFRVALLRTLESCVRSFIAGKKQAEILQLRNEIVTHLKEELDSKLSEWGYHLHDLQVNDITFDSIITNSMAKVVASVNEKAAAENEGQALLIRKTKEAEANGAAIKIAAEAEKAAAQLRGQGIAQFREEVAKGMKQAADTIGDNNDGMTAMMFSMWMDTMKNIAEEGKGNVIFFDGSTDGMERTLKHMQALMLPKTN